MSQFKDIYRERSWERQKETHIEKDRKTECERDTEEGENIFYFILIGYEWTNTLITPGHRTGEG